MILKGSGFFQVDDNCFPIKEGSMIRVASKGVRSLCNTSNEEMVYICIQSRENSLKEHSTDDGRRIEFSPLWNKADKNKGKSMHRKNVTEAANVVIVKEKELSKSA
ncbi:MAG: hypothetical protein LBS04_00270 [Tannerellaceae bacterium]|jgi:uncharacterized cupin superfamily protein|nr:hypothetical protein [Tannerellaceae bacterium]